MNTGTPIIPSDLYNNVYQVVLSRVKEALEWGQIVNPEECLEDCIQQACYWLPEHTLGCSELDCYTTMEEIVESFRKECPEAEIVPTGLNSYTIKFSETYWTIYRIVEVGWSERTKIRIAHKYHSHRGFVPTNKSAWTLKYINSLVPEFRKMAQKIILEGNRHMVITLIQKTADKARRKK